MTQSMPSSLPNASPTVPLHAGVTRLDHLGLIRVSGSDARTFLHQQLTQDFALLGHDTARLAGFCSHQGRLQASFIGWRMGEEAVWLVCPRDLLEATLKRLRMFVLRARVVLEDASDAIELWGLTGSAIPSLEGLPSVWSCQAQPAEPTPTAAIRLPDALGQARVLWAQAAGQAAPAGAVLPVGYWNWLEVRSAVVLLSAANRDAFVPQMLNYESVGGVNFRKGCYPGQEVVARSQFRGTLKRRAHLFHADTPMQAGQAVFQRDDPEQPCGTVVSAAPHPEGGWEALVSLQIAALDGQDLHLEQADGPLLHHLPLPYVLRDDL